jgi:hypothetical protein
MDLDTAGLGVRWPTNPGAYNIGGRSEFLRKINNVSNIMLLPTSSKFRYRNDPTFRSLRWNHFVPIYEPPILTF